MTRENPKHGTVTGYTSDECRCDECRFAMASYAKEYRDRRKGLGVNESTPRKKRRKVTPERPGTRAEVATVTPIRTKRWSHPSITATTTTPPLRAFVDCSEHEVLLLRAALREGAERRATLAAQLVREPNGKGRAASLREDAETLRRLALHVEASA